MNNKALTLSLVMAAIAVFFVQSYVTSIEEEAKKRFGTEVLVLSARKDIREMETINESFLEFKIIPKRFLEPAAISLDKTQEGKETTRTIKSLVGAVAMVPIKKGEQITDNKITEASIRTGLSPQITPGKRAIAISVNETTGISKLVKPGDRVDLIAVIDMGGGKENKIAKTLLQDVIVLSTGRTITNNIARTVELDPYGGPNKVKSLIEDFSFSTVTLEVDAIQAQMLALVTSSGDNAMTLSLRNNDDIQREALATTVFSEILGQDAMKLKSTANKK